MEAMACGFTGITTGLEAALATSLTGPRGGLWGAAAAEEGGTLAPDWVLQW